MLEDSVHFCFNSLCFLPLHPFALQKIIWIFQNSGTHFKSPTVIIAELFYTQTYLAIPTIKTTTLVGLSLHSLFAPLFLRNVWLIFNPYTRIYFLCLLCLKSRSAQSKIYFHSCFNTNPGVLEIHDCLQFCKTKKTYQYTHFSFHVKWTLWAIKTPKVFAPFHTNYGYDINTGVKRAQNLV